MSPFQIRTQATPTRRRLSKFATVAALVALAIPKASHAQRGPIEDLPLNFSPGNYADDGYASASVELRMQVIVCYGEIHAFYALLPGTVQVSAQYFYHGKLRQVPAGTSSPRISSVDISGNVKREGDQFVGSFSANYVGKSEGAGCLGQTSEVAKLADVMPEPRTAQTVQAFVNTLSANAWLREAGPLRNADVEAALAREDDEAQRADLEEKAKRAEAARALKQKREDEKRAYEERRQADRDAEAASQAQRDADAAERRTTDEARRNEQREQTAEMMKAADEKSKAVTDELIKTQAEMWAQQAAMDWLAAETAFAKHDYATAQPLYQKFIGDPFHGAQAEQRLQTIRAETMAQAAAVASQAVDAIGNTASGVVSDISSGMDVLGIPRFGGWFISAEQGSLPNGKAAGVVPPASYMLGLGSYRIFIFELHAGYAVMAPVSYELGVTDAGGYGHATIQPRGATGGGSFGFSYPVRRYVPFVMLGADAMTPNATYVPGKYQVNPKEFMPGVITRASAGLNYRMSRTTGIGLTYSWVSMEAPKVKSGAVATSKAYPNWEFEIRSGSRSTYHTLGVRLFFGLNAPKAPDA